VIGFSQPRVSLVDVLKTLAEDDNLDIRPSVITPTIQEAATQAGWLVEPQSDRLIK